MEECLPEVEFHEEKLYFQFADDCVVVAQVAADQDVERIDCIKAHVLDVILLDVSQLKYAKDGRDVDAELLQVLRELLDFSLLHRVIPLDLGYGVLQVLCVLQQDREVHVVVHEHVLHLLEAIKLKYAMLFLVGAGARARQQGTSVAGLETHQARVAHAGVVHQLLVINVLGVDL